MKTDSLFTSKLSRFGLSVFSVLLAATGLILLGDKVNSTTVALVLLLLVLTSATFFGRNPALLASFIAMLCFNYYFLPPVGTWHIAAPQNLVAWAAFTITAIVAGELSAYARRRAIEAERLYQDLQTAFETATEAKALKQSERLKSALLDAVTHDLRTPLTSIKASVTTLLDSEGGHRTIELDSGGRTDFLDIINEETDRLNRFIESMVQLARVEAGSPNAAGTVSNVEEMISIALDRAEGVISHHNVTVNLQKELPVVAVDARAIAEVLYNLVENAAKYSPHGSTITVSASAEEGAIVVTITDEGKGIPREMREKVFDKFVRLDGGSTDGLGLGLSIARGITESQGGSLTLTDGTNGIGTTVVLKLPIET